MNLAFALQQLRRNLAALGMRRLVMLGVAGSVIFGSIAIGSYWIARSDYQLLYVGLAANDASRIAAVLTELGIPFETSTDGTKVSVPSSAVARTPLTFQLTSFMRRRAKPQRRPRRAKTGGPPPSASTGPAGPTPCRRATTPPPRRPLRCPSAEQQNANASR